MSDKDDIEKENKEKEHDDALEQYVCNDFLGYLKDKQLIVKKMRIIYYYRYFYRFTKQMM